MSSSKSPKLRIGKFTPINDLDQSESKSSSSFRKIFIDPKKSNRNDKSPGAPEKSPREKGLYGFLKSPRSSSSTPRNISPQFKKNAELGIPLYYMDDQEIDFWKEVLTNFQSDIPSSVIEYLTRKDLVDEDRQINVYSALTYYSDTNALANFIGYIVSREITARFEDSQSGNTLYTPFFSSMFAFSGSYLQSELSSSVLKKCAKLKSYTLDDVEGSNSVKAMKKFKEALSEIILSIVNAKTIPNVLQFAYYTMYYLFTLKCKEYLIKTMIRYVFKIPFNSMVTSMVKDSPEHFQTLMVISKLFNTLIDGTTSSTFWNGWLQKNCQDLMNEMMLHIHKKSWLCFDKKNISFSADNPIIPPMDFILSEEWEGLKDYLSNYSFQMILTFKDPQYEMKSRIKMLIQEIDNLRVSTFNENQTYLQKMSEMKMRMKDLQEERRYLKQLLGIEEGNDEEEPKME